MTFQMRFRQPASLVSPMKYVRQDPHSVDGKIDLDAACALEHVLQACTNPSLANTSTTFFPSLRAEERHHRMTTPRMPCMQHTQQGAGRDGLMTHSNAPISAAPHFDCADATCGKWFLS